MLMQDTGLVKTYSYDKEKALAVFDNLDIAETTRADYKARVAYFMDYIARSGLDHNACLSFKRHLAQRTDIAVATKNKYLATARVFLKELHRTGLLPVDITLNIKGFTQNKKHKRDGLNDQEVAKLSERVKSLPATKENARLKAMLSLLALQGLRQVEICRLNVADLDLVAQRAFVVGKGAQDKQPIDLHPDTTKALKEYLARNRVRDGALFVSESNRAKSQRLTTRGLRLIVKDFMHELDIDRCVHGFRHFFTTRLIKTYRGDLLDVARYTRHRSLEMLQVYNDSIKSEADLPRYYSAFEGVSF